MTGARGRHWWAVVALVGGAVVVAAASGVDEVNAQREFRQIPENTEVTDAPDFNGDGRPDFVTGLPLVPVGGPLRGSGAAFVSYGTASGPFRGSAEVITQSVWSDDQGVFDVLGSAVMWGDFDDDGYDDLAVSAHLEDIEVGALTLSDAGRVFVTYGSPTGLEGSTRTPQAFDLNSIDPSRSAQTDDYFGNALAVGDFDGDGVDDLAVGANRAEVADVEDAGYVAVLTGSSTNGLSFRTSITPADTAIDDQARTGGEFGRELAAGDVNGDDVDDLVISNTRANGRDAGAVWVVYGRLEVGPQPGQAPPDARFQPLMFGANVPSQIGDGLGTSLVVGDFDADGYGDIAAGAPFLDVLADSGALIDNAGGVLVVAGSPGGLDPNGSNGRNALQLIEQGRGPLDGVAGPEGGDELGWTLAVGRFNGSPGDDLAVGSPGESIGSTEQAGNVVVLSGAPGVALGEGAPATARWNQDSPGVAGEIERADRFSDSMTAADWNLDGITDLAVGVPDEQTTASIDFSRAGAVNVLFGSSSGLQATNDLFLAGGFEPLNAAFQAAFGPAGRDQQFGYALDGHLYEPDWLRFGRSAGSPPRLQRISSNVDGTVLLLWNAPVDTGGRLVSYTVDGPGELVTKIDSTTGTSVAVFADVPINTEATYTVAVDGQPDLSFEASITPRGALRPLTPARLLETRDVPGFDTVDDRFEGDGPLAAGRQIRLEVAERGGVPADASAAMLNVTAVLPAESGFVTVHPCDDEAPVASNLNYGPGEVVPNSVFAQLSPEGEVCIFTLAATDLVVDVTGYVPASGTSIGVTPARYLETRPGEQTFDGVSQTATRVPAGGVVRVPIAGRNGAVPSGVRTVFVNATVVGPSAPGFLTLYPCDGARPLASNVNYGPGDVIANSVMASLSTTGELCIYSLAETDVLIDVNGYIAEVTSPAAFSPERFADSRTDGSADTIDGRFEATGRLAAGEVWKIDVAGRGSIAEAGTTAALLNVAVINPGGPGFLTVYPCDESRPGASNVNYGPGDIVSNGVLAKLAADGSVCVFTLAAADVLVDATGVIFGDPRLRD